MLCASVLRVVVASVLPLASVGSVESQAEAATILLPVQPAGGAVGAIARGAGADAAGSERSRPVSQAAILPLDDDPAVWWLLAGGIALIGTALRRKRRMPSVTS